MTRALCFVPVLPYTSATHPLPAGEECSTQLGARRPSTGRREWIGCDTGEGMGYCGLAKYSLCSPRGLVAGSDFWCGELGVPSLGPSVH